MLKEKLIHLLGGVTEKEHTKEINSILLRFKDRTPPIIYTDEYIVSGLYRDDKYELATQILTNKLVKAVKDNILITRSYNFEQRQTEYRAEIRVMPLFSVMKDYEIKQRAATEEKMRRKFNNIIGSEAETSVKPLGGITLKEAIDSLASVFASGASDKNYNSIRRKDMDENYIVINGKKAELTEEQLEKLGIKVEKKAPFERVEYGEKYYLINGAGEVYSLREAECEADNKFVAAANYCTDKKLMEQRALHETLNRLLWRFSCENGELDNPWNGKNSHWKIHFVRADKEFSMSCWCQSKCEGTTYFPTKEIAQRAIDEIIKPFMQEHPDFVW